MSNPFFRFKQFTVFQDQCAMKVTTDACLFGAWCAQKIQDSANAQTLLDIGTGTGLLTLMIAQKNKLGIDAIEIDAGTAEQAQNNCTASPFKEQLNVVQQDIAAFTKTGYDVIVSNPPFYESEIQSPSLSKNVAHHSHQLKWKTLFSIVRQKLTSNGSFFLLLPYKRKKELENLLESESLRVRTIIVVKQSPRHAPFRIMIEGSKLETVTNTEELIICDEQKRYTPAFSALLKDYYLYL